MERFQIKDERLKVLKVTVVRAVNVDGCFKKCLRCRLCPRCCSSSSSLLDVSPDPYVTLRVRTSPNAKQQTSVQHDTKSPVWNESFVFCLNPEKKSILELTIMDDDFGLDERIGQQDVELDDLPLDDELKRQIHFGENTVLDIMLLVQYNEKKELRFSYDLCENEKDFIIKRREVIFERMSMMFDDERKPRTSNEVPVIAIMGSGGGYRAACGLSGAFVALEEAGILDCATYVSGLSGSSWSRLHGTGFAQSRHQIEHYRYISTLYVNEKWPAKSTCTEVAAHLRKRFNTNVLRHFRSEFVQKVKRKQKEGRPVGFTDFFGMAIGDALLENQDTKLSHQVHKVVHGQSPLPITTGLRVRTTTSAEVSSEWVEFTPFEYGIVDIGLFGKTAEFGGKFYKGRLLTKFEEAPLHYLLGIWGSAFSILLKRVVDIEKQVESLGKRAEMFGETAKQEIEKCILKETGRLKSEDDESEDEAIPDDEIKSSENWLTEMLNPQNLFTSRRGKAAETFNVSRGLLVKKETDEEYSNMCGKHKTMCVVDSGIAFNSPFPPMLRPERKVELILSFDFSQKDNGDDEPPFVELLKAEQWARDHGLPFPQVKGNPIIEDPIVQECYVFENEDDVTCPTILHFPLVNKTFRDYLEPGVPRETEKDKKFANFSIFDDRKDRYSSFTFQYNHKTFDRLHELMKYNTMVNMDVIKEKIASLVDYRKNNPDYAQC